MWYYLSRSDHPHPDNGDKNRLTDFGLIVNDISAMLVMSISVGMPSVTDLAESWEVPYLAVWLLEPRCMIAALNRESRSSHE